MQQNNLFARAFAYLLTSNLRRMDFDPACTFLLASFLR